MEVTRDEFDEVHAVAIRGNSLDSDDGETWFLPKSLTVDLKIADLPLDLAFDVCNRHENSIAFLDSVPMRLRKIANNRVCIEIDDTGTRKYWNGLIGFKPYMDAKRDVVAELVSQMENLTLARYEDEGNWISLQYSCEFEADDCSTAIELAEQLVQQIEGAAELRVGGQLWAPADVDDEKEFTLRTVIPLIRRLGFQNVRYNHGRREFGRDILFARFTEFGDLEHWGAQVKFGNVSGGAKSDVDVIIGQINDAFTMPFHDIYTRQQQRLSKLAIVISGQFSNNAIEKICEAIENNAARNNTVFVDGERIATLAERFRTP